MSCTVYDIVCTQYTPNMCESTADLGQEGDSKEGRPCGLTEDFRRPGKRGKR